MVTFNNLFKEISAAENATKKSDKKFGIFSKKSEPKEEKIEIPKMIEDPTARKREIESTLMDRFLERQEYGLTFLIPNDPVIAWFRNNLTFLWPQTTLFWPN